MVRQLQTEKEKRAQTAMRNTFKSPVMERFIRGICTGEISIQVAKDASDLFTRGVKLPHDKRIMRKRVEIVCVSTQCSNGNPSDRFEDRLCNRCRSLSWGFEGSLSYEAQRPAYVVHMFRSFEDFLSIPHLPLGLKHFRRVKGVHLRHALLVQHNIRRKLLGMPTDHIFPLTYRFNEIRDAFIVRQRSVSVSRICRALAPLDPHTYVLYEIIRRVVPAEASRVEIVRIADQVMQLYRN